MILSIFSTAFVLALVVLTLIRNGTSRKRELSHANEKEVALPFNVPCAVDLADAGKVYDALKHRNRSRLDQLFEDKKIVSLPKGLRVHFAHFGPTAMITIGRGDAAGTSCFVPAEIVPVIQRNVSH